MDDIKLSAKIARACVDAGVHPGLPDGLPEGCPIPPMQVFSAQKFPAMTLFPENWRVTVMLEQQIGSLSYWVPLHICGPCMPADWRDGKSSQGWRVSFWPQSRSRAFAYTDLSELNRYGWWPDLDRLWREIPATYKHYDPAWRRESDCDRCACTSVELCNLIVLPCPRCRTTPSRKRHGYQDLVWVPAHTPERRPHVESGKRWRYHGGGYVVEHLLGDAHLSRQARLDIESLHVGLRLVEDPVPPGWGDHDVDSEGSLALVQTPRRRPGLLRRLQRRVEIWSDHSFLLRES